jgi:hypothetical protein
VAFDGAGNLYASFAGQNFAYKAIPSSGGVIANATTPRYAGTGTQGYSGDGGDPLAALVNGPQGVAVSKAGNLYIADTGNNVIRAVLNGATTNAGSSVSVNPLDQSGSPRSDITLTFDDVTTAGATTVVVGPTGPSLPAGFVLASVPPVFFDIVTTAQFTGSIKICVNPAPAGSELVHFVNGVQDTTATPASGSGVCISVTSLSPFALVKPVVQNVAPAITSANKATFQTGAAGAFTVTATGTPDPTLSETGALPGGVNFNNSTGVLGGVPEAGTGGVYSISFAATNGVSPDAQQSFALTIDQAPVITSTSASTFQTGVAGAFTVAATGYPAPALTESGALPTGVTFNPATGVLSGMPATGTGGLYSISFAASNGVSPSVQQNFVLTIDQAPGITSAAGTTFTLGAANSFLVTGSGFPFASFVESGALPAGVIFTDNHNGTGMLSGTPTAAGVFNISFTATNGVGSGATESFTLTVPGGGPIAKVSTTSINFGKVNLFHLGTRTVTLINTGTSTLKIGGILVTPGPETDRDDFLSVSACKPTLAPGKSCAIYVFFLADEVGTHTATLNITDNAPGSPQQVSLTGTAIRSQFR